MSDPITILQNHIETGDPMTHEEMVAVMTRARDIGVTTITGGRNALKGLNAYTRQGEPQAWRIDEAQALLERMRAHSE